MKGNSEVKDFLRDLNLKAKTGNAAAAELLDIIQYTMSRVREEGPIAGMPYTRKLRGEIWELRPTKFRVTYFLLHNKMVLLTIFRKQSQTTPSHEIDRAEKRMKDWVKRNGK